MKERYKSKEFALTLYISAIILVCIYKLIEIILEFNRQISSNNTTDVTEYEWGYLAIFLVVCLIIYELLMFAWSLILLKENHLLDKGKFSFIILLFTSSIPVLLLIRLYYLQYGG
ncbi:MAG: hypothetical protein CVV25_07045 [Ignavibacteriae bacterium HGW-Ignavibacteriae-4]|jgi:hypothetical protein|nr:MAG: hypothetical protein CVV25_07045 [Ignavibacteriae bacterium HGW-Ignavibacteriae-4]